MYSDLPESYFEATYQDLVGGWLQFPNGVQWLHSAYLMPVGDSLAKGTWFKSTRY